MSTENPQIHFVEVEGTHLSLGYIRENAMEILGKTHIGSGLIGRYNHYHATIPGAEFNIGKSTEQVDKWRSGAAVNSLSAAEAIGNYFLHLRDACGIRKGKKKFRWSTTELRFEEIQ